MRGGNAALHREGLFMLGPRLGKYTLRGEVRPIPAHNMPMVVLGTFILAFGWFGFNPGSTLAGTDLRIAVVAVNTMLASATATRQVPRRALSHAAWSLGSPRLLARGNGPEASWSR